VIACPALRDWVASAHMSHLPPQEYYATLPKHIAGAGAIFRDTDGGILLVKPAYRQTWEIPGGGLEHGEDPWAAAVREVKEETGLELRPGRLLAVDWVPPQDDGRPALANFLFDGGLLGTGPGQQDIQLQDGELTSWTMAAPGQWEDLLAPHMARRVRACAAALDTGTTAYLHYGWPAGDALQ
jgi:ADP-ribose pyrophosphatase YjhB (NUDIX family)